MLENSLIIKPRSNDPNSHTLVQVENVKIYTFLSSYGDKSKNLYLKVIKDFFKKDGSIFHLKKKITPYRAFSHTLDRLQD